MVWGSSVFSGTDTSGGVASSPPTLLLIPASSCHSCDFSSCRFSFSCRWVLACCSERRRLVSSSSRALSPCTASCSPASSSFSSWLRASARLLLSCSCSILSRILRRSSACCSHSSAFFSRIHSLCRCSSWPTCSSSCCTRSFPAERSARSCSSRASLSTFNAATCSSRPFSCLPHWARSSSACWHAWTWVCKSAFWLAHLLLQLLHPLLPRGALRPQLLLTGVSLHLQRGHLLFQALQLSSTLGPLLQRLLARVDLGLQVGLLGEQHLQPLLQLAVLVFHRLS
ncbi:uncharacterized protein LOC125367343 [Perognathus longimembris pacificus]|uniref:uncharacterized protein LOC125367343 n=1 Tax=Perognathus longimembris pacificus TaxID=214514 RepID=UPI00201A1556|nr:uncharacterized protein LOC125367343 [Perognathus longimembris pacificus]